MDKTKEFTTELSRELSLFQITMMGLGMMIGAGVFLGIGNSIFVAGPGGVVLTFALNTLIALFTAMSYAELSSAVPRAGGAYNFARIGFGRGTSFLAGWMEWFASSVAGSMYAITFSIYTLRYLEQLGLLAWLPAPLEGALIKIVAVLVALGFIYINYRGASETGRVGAIMTLGQTVFLIFIGAVGIVVALRDPARLQNFKPFLPYGWSRLLITMGFTYVAFEGFEVIAQAGDEAIEPRKNLPKAMIYSVYIAGMTYVAVAFATVIAVKAGSPGVVGAPWEWIGSFRERGFGEAIAMLIPWGNFLLTLAVIFASTSALNATIFSATRASYALGRDRMLPSLLARISRKRKTPWAALVFTSVIIITVVSFLPTMDVASSASIMFLFLFFLVNICVIKIRLNMGDELDYGFLMPLFPVLPIAAIICQAVLAAWLGHMSRIAWIIAPLWILAGLTIYMLYSRKRAIPSEDEILVLEEERAPAGSEYRVMVPVANPDNALSLVGNTIRLCGARKSRVKLLHMVSVPDQVPLTDAHRYMTDGREGIVEAMLYLLPRFPITTTLRYCRNIARGIISAVREKKINLLIMGWHGRSRDQRFKIGSTLDPVIARSPCDIVILKDCSNRKFRRILVPLFGDGNDAFALEVAGLLAEKEEAHISALFFSNLESKRSGDRYIQELLAKVALDPGRVKLRRSASTNIERTVLAGAEDFDLVVIGLKERFLHQIGVLSAAETIARKIAKPLVIVKATKGLSSWTKRWI
jgi:APA family basic amino acid/polyamine antiporter